MQASLENTNYSPSLDHQWKMDQLHDEFNRKAKIQGLVSYIYYPTQRENPFIGHGELEIEGDSWTLTSFCVSRKPISRMIYSSTLGEGFPFFRFKISVTPKQLSKLRNNVSKTRSCSCSYGALSSLSRNGKYSVPLPFSYVPSLSAAYLGTAKMLGSDRVKKIQFIGGESYMLNLSKSAPGVVYELFLLLSTFFIAAAVFRTLS